MNKTTTCSCKVHDSKIIYRICAWCGKEYPISDEFIAWDWHICRGCGLELQKESQNGI